MITSLAALFDDAITRESLVDVSPSTVIKLKDLATTCFISSFNIFCEILTSSIMKASMVAIFGLIMPEPFAIPVQLILWPSILKVLLIAFGIVSVVIIAFAASSQSDLNKNGFVKYFSKDFIILATGIGCKMTPVENGRT